LEQTDSFYCNLQLTDLILMLQMVIHANIIIQMMTTYFVLAMYPIVNHVMSPWSTHTSAQEAFVPSKIITDNGTK